MDVSLRHVSTLLVLGGFGLVLMHASAQARAGSGALQPAPAKTVLARVVEAIAPAPAPEPVEVWEGRDVDGDGAGDFVNPTGEAVREHDDYGLGRFGASRDGGTRDHAGVDFVSEAGQKVVAPISGYVTRIGYAYDDAPELRYVEISNPALRYTARVLYVRPSVKVGQAVRLGTPIGKAATLQERYPGITDHVHLEVMRRGARVNPETVLAVRETSGLG